MGTKIKFPVTVRLMLLDFLVEETGRRSRLKLLRKLQEDLSISEEESKLLGFVETVLPDGKIYSKFEKLRKNPELDPMKEIEIGEVYLEIICNKLKGIEEGEKLTQAQTPLYDIFEPYITGSAEEKSKK